MSEDEIKAMLLRWESIDNWTDKVGCVSDLRKVCTAYLTLTAKVARLEEERDTWARTAAEIANQRFAVEAERDAAREQAKAFRQQANDLASIEQGQRQELNAARAEVAREKENAFKLHALAQKAEAKSEERRRALERFGQHLPECYKAKETGERALSPCSCGFDAALKDEPSTEPPCKACQMCCERCESNCPHRAEPAKGEAVRGLAPNSLYNKLTTDAQRIDFLKEALEIANGEAEAELSRLREENKELVAALLDVRGRGSENAPCFCVVGLDAVEKCYDQRHCTAARAALARSGK